MKQDRKLGQAKERRFGGRNESLSLGTSSASESPLTTMPCHLQKLKRQIRVQAIQMHNPPIQFSITPGDLTARGRVWLGVSGPGCPRVVGDSRLALLLGPRPTEACPWCRPKGPQARR